MFDGIDAEREDRAEPRMTVEGVVRGDGFDYDGPKVVVEKVAEGKGGDESDGRLKFVHNWTLWAWCFCGLVVDVLGMLKGPNGL